MKRLITLLILFGIVLNYSLFTLRAFSKDEKNKPQKAKQLNKELGKIKKVEFATDDVKETEELIVVQVRNDFDEEIKVKFDTNREYPIGPKESITLGKRKPGRYTLTIYNKKGDFVDNLTRSIDKRNKFLLNENTVSNSNKITGLSTGQKVAITAGAVGAAALGTALIHMALQQDNQAANEYVPPPPPDYVPPQGEQVVQQIAPVGPGVTAQVESVDNAFAPGGKAFKFLNAKYEKVTVIVEGADGNPIGNNWVIPKGSVLQKPQPLIFNSEKITINPDQKVIVVIPSGIELQRYPFELEQDPFDGGYVWVVK